MTGKKKVETDIKKINPVDSEWSDISNFVAAFAENNERIDNGVTISHRIVKEDDIEHIPAYQPQTESTTAPQNPIGVSIQKEFHFMDKEFKEVSGNFQGIKNELNDMLKELGEIREARLNLQTRLDKIS
ncbi:MAG: hypothetical protein ABUK01_04490 [Leptospirales bacterium]